MIDRFGIHRPDHTNIVGDAANFRQHATEFRPALPVTLKGLDRGGNRPPFISRGHRGKSCRSADAFWNILTRHFLEGRFWIKKVNVRRATTLPEADHPLGFRSDLGQTNKRGLPSAIGHRRSEERGEGDPADSVGGLAEKLASGDALVIG